MGGAAPTQSQGCSKWDLARLSAALNTGFGEITTDPCEVWALEALGREHGGRWRHDLRPRKKEPLRFPHMMR
jgi:hypothetical protein